MSYRSELVQVAAVALAAVQNLDRGSTETESPEALRYILFSLMDEVTKERNRQEGIWGAQNHKPEHWMVILMEEVGEASRSILENNVK